MSKINFIKSDQIRPRLKLYKFHQICTFKDPRTSKYSVRTIIHNENNEIEKVYEKRYSHKECQSLISRCKENHYKCYHTYELDQVDPPNVDDLYKTHSDLLSNSNLSDYANYSKF